MSYFWRICAPKVWRNMISVNIQPAKQHIIHKLCFWIRVIAHIFTLAYYSPSRIWWIKFQWNVSSSIIPTWPGTPRKPHLLILIFQILPPQSTRCPLSLIAAIKSARPPSAISLQRPAFSIGAVKQNFCSRGEKKVTQFLQIANISFKIGVPWLGEV